MNLSLWLDRTVQAIGGRPALLLGEPVVADDAGFAGRAAGVADALSLRGLSPGERVGIFAKNLPDYLACFYGIWRAGTVAAPINAKLPPREAAWILDDPGARLCFVSADLARGLAAETGVPSVEIGSEAFEVLCTTPAAETVPRDAGDTCWLFHTSGTTGKPKGVRITHGMLAATSLCYLVDVDPVTAEDAAPMSHGAGIYAPIHVRMGAAHIVPASGVFDPAEVMDISLGHGATAIFMAPTMVRRLVDAAKAADRRGEGISTIVHGGGSRGRRHDGSFGKDRARDGLGAGHRARHRRGACGRGGADRGPRNRG